MDRFVPDHGRNERGPPRHDRKRVGTGRPFPGRRRNQSREHGIIRIRNRENGCGRLSSGLDVVTITGSGWRPGETVTLTLVESPLFDTHGPYNVVADGNGNISDSSFVTDEHDLNIRFYLTAVGSQSGVTGTEHIHGCQKPRLLRWDCNHQVRSLREVRPLTQWQ